VDFNEARDDEVAVASAGPHADHHISTSSLIFTGQMLFMTANQQHQSTEGKPLSTRVKQFKNLLRFHTVTAMSLVSSIFLEHGVHETIKQRAKRDAR